MANQSMKQQIYQSIVNSQLQQIQQEKIDQLNADFSAFMNQQQDVDSLNADFSAWKQSQAQEAQAAKIPSIADTQPKRDLQAEAREYFAKVRQERRAQAAEEERQKEIERQKNVAKKAATNETLGRLGVMTAIDQQKAKGNAEEQEDIEQAIQNVDRYVPQDKKQSTNKEKALEQQILNADKYNVPTKEQKKSDDVSLTDKEKEIIQKYAEAKNVSLEQAQADYLKGQKQKGQTITAPGTVNEELTKAAQEQRAEELRKANQKQQTAYESFLNGMGNAVTAPVAGIPRLAGALTGNNWDLVPESAREQYRNANEQHPVATGAGNLVGMMMLAKNFNPITNPEATGLDAFNAARGEAILNGATKAEALKQGAMIGGRQILGNAARQMPFDVAVDILPTLANDVAEGKSTKDIVKNTVLNTALNYGFNALPEVLDVAKAAKQGLPNLTPPDVVEQAAKQYDEAAKNLENTAKKYPVSEMASYEDATRNIIRVPDNIQEIAENNKALIKEMDSVSVVDGEMFKGGEGSLKDKVLKFFTSRGNKAHNDILGDVELTKTGIKGSIAHNKLTRRKVDTFASVPDVIEKGKIISYEPAWKGRDYDTAIIAAPTKVRNPDGTIDDFITGVVVKRDKNQQRFYAHDAVSINMKEPSMETGTPSINGQSSRSDGSLSIYNILRKLADDKYQANKNTINRSTIPELENMAETTVEGTQFKLPSNTEDAIFGDTQKLWNAYLESEDVVKAANDESVNNAYARVRQAINDYENKLFRSEDMDEVEKARKELTNARKNLERKLKKVDPNLKAEITKYEYGPLTDNAKYYRDALEPPTDEQIYDELRLIYDLEGKTPEEIDELINADKAYQAGLKAEENAFNQRMGSYNSEDMSMDVTGPYSAEDVPETVYKTADEAIEPNKVMAEDTGIKPTKQEKVEPLRIEDEVPPTEPVKPETTTPENGDYVSKFRTHNEQNFNMTDEELNNKYFNTQNENFHFLKGDRAADLENATKNLETDYDGTVNKLLNKPTDTQFTPQEVDEGFMAWNRELNAGRETGEYGKAADIMYRMTRDSHDKGAGLQAYAAWKKNSPAGVVLDASESARRMAVDQFGSNYVKELDSLTDKIDDICKGDGTLDDKIKQINKLMKDAQGKGYKNGITGAEQMEELLKTGDNIDVSHIHDILFEANKVPNLSASAQAEIADIASEMYGRELTAGEKREYINRINMILSREKNWTIKDKAIEISHILMLSGSKTHLKNFVANVGMLPQEALARKISAIGQGAYKHFVDPNYKPTQSFVVGKEAKNLATEAYEAKGGADAIAADVADKFTGKLADKIGANYMFGVGKENIASKANKALTKSIPQLKKLEETADEWANKALKKIGSEGAYDAMDSNVSLLENYRQFIYGSLSGLEDNPFVKKNYVDRLASYIQAQGFKSLDEIPEEAFDIARAEALKATFKDDNAITDLFKSVKNIPGVGELLLPFVKTPANLLARSIDFSPIGLARSLYGALNKNSRFAKDTIGETIDEISKGTGGTLTMLLGMWMYANGLITGKKSDDADIANYMANEGWQQYSVSTKGIADFINSRLGTDLDLGDSYYDFSFLQPSTTNMIAAEEVYDEITDGKKLTEKDFDSIFNRAKSIAGSYTDALLAQSTMQNIADTFGSQYSDEGVGGNLIQNALEWPTRFTSGALSDTMKLSDDTKREYYSKNKPIETVKNAVVSKLPGLSKTLPAKYDVFGQEMTRNQSTGSKWINTLLNPATAAHKSDNPLYGYVDRLNEASQSGDYVPTKTLRKIKLNDETELSLDNKQYSEASRISGEMRKSILTDVMKNDMFNTLGADDRVEILDSLEKVALSTAYTSIDKNAKVTQEAQKVMDMYKEGGVDAVIKNYVGKKLAKDAGVSTSTNAAEAAMEAVNNGDIDGAKKILDAEAQYNAACEEAGVENKNSGTRKAYDEGGVEGLKEYVNKQNIYGQYDMSSSTAESIYNAYGEEGLKTFEEQFKPKGLTDKRALDVYESALKGSDPIPSLDKWISTYKTIDSLGKSNGHVDQTEFKAYLNKGSYTVAEAEELARIYGDWSTTPYINKKGQWSFH